MNQIYAIDKETNAIAYTAASLALLKAKLAEVGKTLDEFLILGDIVMKFVSRIVYVDGACIYNNCDYWLNHGHEILDDYDQHEVKDILGNDVDIIRYRSELDSNITRITQIDGRPGEVEYNMEVASEMIALFKEECILTKFIGITPLEIAEKLAPAYTLVLTGSFREAKTVFQALDTDPFLTEERKQKYIDMLDAADSIEYASGDELIFTTEPTEEPEIPEELVEYVRAFLMDQSQNMTKEHTFYYAALIRDPEKTTDTDKPWLSEDDRLIYVIRHAERDSDGSSTTDINSTGIAHAKSIGTQLAYGNAPASSYATCTIPFETNDAHYFATELVRTQHTAQCIAEGRGDTDSSASDYSGITIDQELLEGYRYLKSRPASGTTELLKKYANQPENLTQDELTTYFGVSSADEARSQIVSDTQQFINEIINAADKFGKRLNFFITSDYYIGCMQAGVTGLQYNQTGNNPWVNWCSGVAIVVHPDNTYDAFAVKCSKK